MRYVRELACYCAQLTDPLDVAGNLLKVTTPRTQVGGAPR
jgi:hypothetical protein